MLCLLLGCAHTEQRDQPRVRKIEFVGNRALDDATLKGKISTTTPSWIPFTERPYFDRNVWRTDLKRIERYYQAQGYYQARVVASEVRQVDEQEVALEVQVDEGVPTFVTSVEVQGLSGLAPEQRRQLEAQWPLQTGQVFREQAWNEFKPTIREALLELGYVTAKVEGQATVDLATQEATIAVRVDPGLRYAFGDIEVAAVSNGKVEPWRIKEQVREAIEGEPYYSTTARLEAQNRVVRMDVFGAVRVLPGTPDPLSRRVPLVVEVQEAPFHSVRGGFGIGIDPVRNDAHVVGGYVHRNFLGDLRRFELRGLVGWAFLPSLLANLTPDSGVVTKSQPIGNVTVELEQPRFFHPNLRLGTQLTVERDIEQAFEFYGGTARIGVLYQPNLWFSFFPNYNLQVYRLSGRPVVGGDAPPILFGCPTQCIVSFMEQTVAVDRRDSLFEPKSGYYLAFSLQEGGGPLGGVFAFVRLVPEARVYRSFLEQRRLTLSARVRLGSLLGFGRSELDTPIISRFFSGGDAMRGFGTNRLSPLQLVPRDDLSQEIQADTAPIGGNGVFEASFEARYGLTSRLVLAAFVDTGLVTLERLQFRVAYLRDNLQLAVGGGLRYRTPVGPIRLDLAYRPDVGPPLRIFPSPEGVLNFERSQGCFGIGPSKPNRAGAPEGPCAIHLSIGEAF